MSNINFTKPLQMTLSPEFPNPDWIDVVYIGPYKNKHVIADAEGEYHTVYESSLRNKPVKPTTKELYNYCVQSALVEGFGWANQEKIIELIYDHLVLDGLIKEEN